MTVPERSKRFEPMPRGPTSLSTPAEKVIFWLGQHGSAENARYLRSLYGKLKSQDLKKKVLFSLSQMGGRGKRPLAARDGAGYLPGSGDAEAGALLGRTEWGVDR